MWYDICVKEVSTLARQKTVFTIARKSKGITMDQLADKMNVTRQTIFNWEHKLAQPDVHTILVLQGILELSLDDLMEHFKEVNK